MRKLGLGLTVVTVSGRLAAQAPLPPDSLEFGAVVRAATARYHDRAAAIADGYRAIGPDAPAMGQHWVHPRRVLGGRVDPAEPSILMYTAIDGTTTLIGVAYARALVAGEADPAAPARASDWHFHSGSVTDEATLPDHTGHLAGREDQARVAVLHAWTGVPNPAGPFAADNWALPFLRLGLTPPADPDRTVARGLSLLAGGALFFTEQLGSVADLGGPALRRARGRFEQGAAELARWWSRRATRKELSENDARDVQLRWNTVVEAVLREVPVAARGRLRAAWL